MFLLFNYQRTLRNVIHTKNTYTSFVMVLLGQYPKVNIPGRSRSMQNIPYAGSPATIIQQTSNQHPMLGFSQPAMY